MATRGLKQLEINSVTYTGGPVVLDTDTIEFSGTTSATIQDIFSLEYENYRIFLHMENFMGTTTPYIRLGSSGVVDSSSNYRFRSINAVVAGVTNSESSETYLRLSPITIDESDKIWCIIDLMSVPQFSRTIGINKSHHRDHSSGVASHSLSSFTHTNFQSWTDITIGTSTGTTSFNGTLSIYGYVK